MKRPISIAVLALVFSHSVVADSVDARCDIYQRGSDHASKMIACNFSQRQGHITITRSDGVTYDLTPIGDKPGNYRDQNGHKVYRQSGLGDQGQVFRLKDQSVFVYWSTAALDAQSDEDNWSAPFSTKDYDATTRLRCRAAGDSEFGSCPAGILRMENGQASIVIQNQLGEEFTINFLTDEVNATNGKVEAHFEAGIWTVTTANGEVYEVPLAAIEGG